MPMNYDPTYRVRKRNTLNRITDPSKDRYVFMVNMTGRDRDYLAKALEKREQEVGFAVSNPMLLSYLLREYVDNG